MLLELEGDKGRESLVGKRSWIKFKGHYEKFQKGRGLVIDIVDDFFLSRAPDRYKDTRRNFALLNGVFIKGSGRAWDLSTCVLEKDELWKHITLCDSKGGCILKSRYKDEIDTFTVHDAIKMHMRFARTRSSPTSVVALSSAWVKKRKHDIFDEEEDFVYL